MAVSESTTRKKSKASSVHPRKPAKTAAPWPSFAGTVTGAVADGMTGGVVGGVIESSGPEDRSCVKCDDPDEHTRDAILGPALQETKPPASYDRPVIATA